MTPPKSVRLRRAIHLKSLSLVRRIILSSPDDGQLVRNVDFDNKCSTSLHLAAELGLLDIAEFLVSQGHEDEGISRNEAGVTPLMVSAAAGPDTDTDEVAGAKLGVAQFLVHQFPEDTAIRDKEGQDAFCWAARHGTIPLLNLLLTVPPPTALLLDPDLEMPATPGNLHPFLSARDNSANTALHHACAWGQVAAVHLLVSAGADASARNAFMWTPIDYSASVQAEVYVKRLVGERDDTLSNLRRDTTSTVAPVFGRTRQGSYTSGTSGASSAGSREDAVSPSFGAATRDAFGRMRGYSEDKLRGGRAQVRLVNPEDSVADDGTGSEGTKSRGRAQT